MSLTFEQQMWDKWSDDDEERAYMIPEYRKETIGNGKKKSTLERQTMASECSSK